MKCSRVDRVGMSSELFEEIEEESSEIICKPFESVSKYSRV